MKALYSLLLVLACAISALVLPAAWEVAVSKSSPDVSALVSASVIVGSQDGYGSGVVFKNGRHVFVWTDAHVVSGNRVSATEFAPAWVAQDKFHPRRAIIIRYSERHDIALMRLEASDWPDGSVVFARNNDEPKPGEAIWHVGSMGGPPGINSVSDGVFSCANRLRLFGAPNDSGIIYDQVSLNSCQRGSSGGGVFRKSTLECLGLVTEYLGPGFSWGAMCMTPTRRLRQMAKQSDCLWAVTRDVAVPRSDRHPVVVE